MIKLYTNQSYLGPKNRKFVFPLLFDLYYVPNKNLLNKYQLVGAIDDCDIVVVPIDIARFDKSKDQQKLNDFIDQAIGLNKIVWMYSAGDYGQSIHKKVHTFRLGGFDSKLDEQTFIMPSFINDPYSSLSKEFKTITKLPEPQIGFVGHASGSVGKWIKEFLLFARYNCKRFVGKVRTDYQPFYPSASKRYHFLKILSKNEQLKTNFVYRNQYRAGVKTEPEKTATTLEFFKNMESNPYTFCLRGTGNFSVRFYETLAMGRIPLIVDTDFRLPLNCLINWEKHCVVVKADQVVETLVDFHQKISAEDFELMQQNNRKLWLTYLQREAYFLNMYWLFKEK